MKKIFGITAALGLIEQALQFHEKGITTAEECFSAIKNIIEMTNEAEE